jgi:uncharacterized protein with FMN-binding domain
LQSSNPYTAAQVKTPSRWLGSTLAIIAVSIGGAWVVDNHLNPPAAAITQQPAPTGSTGSGTGTKADMTVTGAVVPYQFGVMQLEVVRTSGKISAVNIVQGTASAGRDGAIPYLQQYAVQAQGSNFSNISGATYTTDAFKQALDSAISKLS